MSLARDLLRWWPIYLAILGGVLILIGVTP